MLPLLFLRGQMNSDQQLTKKTWLLIWEWAIQKNRAEFMLAHSGTTCSKHVRCHSKLILSTCINQKCTKNVQQHLWGPHLCCSLGRVSDHVQSFVCKASMVCSQIKLNENRLRAMNAIPAPSLQFTLHVKLPKTKKKSVEPSSHCWLEESKQEQRP